MLNELNNIVTFLNNYIWGIGMLVLVVGSGLYFTIRLHGFQFVHFKDIGAELLTNKILTQEFQHSVPSVRRWRCVLVQVT